MKQFVMMIFAFATFMACGDDNNGTTERILTDADMFVASEQFQEYQEVVDRDRSEIRSIVNRMSAKEKKRYIMLLDSAVHTDSHMRQTNFVRQLTMMTGINYSHRALVLYNAKNKAFKNINICRTDYLRALQRYNIRIDLQNKTRSIDNESQCLTNCMTSYRIATSACEYCGIGNWDLSAVNPNDDIDEIIRKNLDRLEYEQWCDYRTCILNADLEYEQCEDKC